MPLYEYECESCGRRFEVIQKFSDSVETCRLCGKGPVQRLLSSPAIQFKGSGWYVTDYSQKGKSDSSSTTPAGKTGDTTKSDSTSDTTAGKTDKAADTKSAPASTPKSKE